MTQEQIAHPSFTIPESVKKQIKLVHNTEKGHFGVEQTHKKLISKGYKAKRLRAYILRCPYCQLTNQRSIKTVIQPSTYDSMTRLNIDTIGPLDISVHGYQYILVIIDTFSRYITLWPTRSTTAIEAADAIIQHVGFWHAKRNFD
jgi:hypothetical protein